MKIAFIYKGAENLGIEALSAFLREHGHQTRLFFDPAVFSGDVFINSAAADRFLKFDRQIVRAVTDAKPDVVAFSAYTGNYQWCLALAKMIKEAIGVPVVFGGVHPTAVPEVVLKNPFVDYVIRGEGEEALLELIEHVAARRAPEDLHGIKNLAFMSRGAVAVNPVRPYIQELDAMPFSDKEMFFDAEPVLKRNPYLILSARGCPYTCSYCCNDLIHGLYQDQKGRHIRRRSTDNVLEELALAKERFAMRSVGFLDDVFTISQAWLEDFLPRYKARIGLPFHCNIHPVGFNAALARLLKIHGCRLVFLGVQSGSERVRKEVFLRHESNDSIVGAVRHLKAAGLPFNVDHIFGAPGEAEEDLVQSYALYRAIRPDMLQSFWMTYYPGTRIVGIAVEKGALSAKGLADIQEGRSGFTHGTGSVREEMVGLYKKYELLFEVLTVVRSDLFLKIVAPVAAILPFKKFFSNALFAMTGLVYFPSWIFNKFRYLLFSRKSLHDTAWMR